MERRDFLLGAAGAAGLPMIGCSSTPPASTLRTISDPEADAIIAHLDRALDATAGTRVLSDFAPELARRDDPATRTWLAHGDSLALCAAQSLLIGDAGGMVPTDARPSERLIQRFGSLAPRLGEAVTAHTALFEQMPLREKQRMNDVLRREHDLPMRIGEALDAKARELGASPAGRGKMRRILTDITARARAQSFSLITDECAEKVHRVAAHRGEDAALRQALATQLAASAFWTPALAQTQATTPPSARAVGSSTPSSPSPAPDAGVRAPRGVGGQIAGAWMLGLGAATWGLGWGIGGALGLSAGGVLVFIGTLGAVVAIAGLITVIVATIVRAAS